MTIYGPNIKRHIYFLMDLSNFHILSIFYFENQA